jgi:outer membrane receptor protein involved in Fe transport
MDSAAFYVSNHWQWERLSLNAGARYSWFEIFLPETAEVAAVKLKPDDLTADIHLSYELAPGLRLLSNIGRGFRPPNIFDLGTLGSRPGNRFNIPNTALKPESVWSYDLGFKASTERWQTEIYTWYSDYQDAISSRFTGDMTSDGRQIVRSDNLNSMKLYGIESGFRYLARDDIQIYAVINYTRGNEQEPDGQEVPGDRIPPLNGRLGLVYEPADTLRLETYLDYSGRQDRLSPRDVDDPRIDPTGTDAWGTINMLLNWQPVPKLELGLRLENLLDNTFREHGSGIDAPGRNIGIWINTSF